MGNVRNLLIKINPGAIFNQVIQFVNHVQEVVETQQEKYDACEREEEPEIKLPRELMVLDVKFNIIQSHMYRLAERLIEIDMQDREVFEILKALNLVTEDKPADPEPKLVA